MDDDNKQQDTEEGAASVSEDVTAQLRRERDDYLEGWKRAKADFINYKKDEIKRFSEFGKFATENLIRELIAVLDSFELAIPKETDEQSQRGLYLIRQQLDDVLRQYGIRRIEAKAGEPFDPALHEAIAEVEADAASGTIVEELGPGYFLHEKLIRPARVKVAK